MTYEEKELYKQLKIWETKYKDCRSKASFCTLQTLAYWDKFPKEIVPIDPILSQDRVDFFKDFCADAEPFGSWYHAPMGDQRALENILYRERGVKAADIAETLGFYRIAAQIALRTLRAFSREEQEYENSMCDYWRHG